MPRRKRVVLGVTGSIAAYKSAEIVRGLTKAGHEVRCVLSAAGARFITPLTLSALSKNEVVTDLDDASLWRMAHLSLADWADVVLVAPATADCLARLACGRAEDALGALALATKAPLVLCPAMDAGMWRHAATVANVTRLKSYGCRFWGPEKGELASGKRDWGRLLEPAKIVAQVARL